MGWYDSFVIRQSAGYCFDRYHWLTNCFIIHTQKIPLIQLNEKIPWSNICHSQHSLLQTGVSKCCEHETFKFGPVKDIPLSLTFWLMCFKSHLSHLVKYHSYGRLNTVRWNSNALLVFRLLSDFYDLIHFHISQVICWSSSTTSADWHRLKQRAQNYVHLMSLWGR